MNRALIVVSLFTISLAAVVTKVASGQAPAGAKPVDQVAQLERDWLAADGKGDVAALRRIALFGVPAFFPPVFCPFAMIRAVFIYFSLK